MPLLLHRAERAVVLVDELAALLGSPLSDPFTPEVIAVPAKGVERWLTQRLSTGLGAVDGDGVAANLQFPSPTRLVDDAVAAASGTAAEDDPWAPQRMLWQLLDLMDSYVGEPWCAVLSHHIGHGADDHRAGRRYAAAEHLRDLFRSYAAHRPTMLVAWAAGDESGLDPDLRWQAELWRRLRTALDAPSPAERLSQTCRQLVDEPEISTLPPRLSVFGATRLSTAQRQVLQALGERRDVHLWLPHPSPAVWEAISTAPTAATRREDHSGLLVRHPLTASLSRDVRELQQLLGDVDTVHHGAASTGTSLLAQVQAAIREDRAPQPTATADGTVQVHACHGPPRQVEVLREALLALFQADPSLEPRDVLVMCPDIETYAPLVRAAFGQPASETRVDHPGHRLRVRLADRALRQTNPLLDTLSGLLELAGGRVTATQVLDLAATAPVRRQFGLDDDDLERLRDWAGRAGVRWGLGDSQREAYSLGAVRQGTWRTGLDRILLGVAADETDLGWLDLALPLDDVDSSDIDLAGRLAELVDRLDHVLATLQGPQPLADWVLALTQALELLTSVTDADAWQLGQALRELSEAGEHGGAAVLRLADLRHLLRGRLTGKPTRANFRTGALTVCTMVPMRSVPHRVIALLGLDDGVFPRGGAVDGDDVLQRDPRPGERDPRSEDRQLLLDALMSAGDHLLLLYTGADPVTGATRPPAVPLGELVDVVRTTAAGGHDVVRRHPLQPFDPSNFTAPPFSFDRGALAGAQAARGPRTEPAPLIARPLPATTGDVELSRLIGFLVHPAKAFLAQRLGIRVPDRQDVLTDDLRAELGPLEKWDVGERMLQARLSGVDLVDFRQAELRRGTLPPGPIALRLLSELEETVQGMAAVAEPHLLGARRRLDLTRDLDGRRLTGTVSGLHGQVLVRATYSRLAPKHRLTAWVQLLAAGLPTAVTIGKGAYGRVAVSTLTLPADPLVILRDLVALRDEGLCEPLPMATAATHAYASRRAAGDTDAEALAAARKAWNDMFGDATDEHVRYVHGGDVDTFIGAGARFAALASRLWDPLLAAES